MGVFARDRFTGLRRVAVAGAAAAAAVVTMATLAPQAHALNCGRTIYRDITLQEDIVGCLSDGLTIGENGVDLDLNGHTIDGTGLGVGIRNDGFDNVTIKNGTVSDFDYGVQLGLGTLDATVNNLSLTLTQVRAMQLRNTDSSEFTNNSIGEGSRGLQVAGGSTDNQFTGNTFTKVSNDSIQVTGSPRNTFTSNRISWTGDSALEFQRSPRTTLTGNTIIHNSDAAVTLLASGNSTVQKNRILDSSDAGFVAQNSTGLTFQNNIVRNVGDSLVLTNTGAVKFIGNTLETVHDGGLFVESHNNVIKDNTITGIGDSGFDFTASHDNVISGNTMINVFDTGIELLDSDNNLMENNTLTTVGDAAFKLTNSHENQILNSTANGAGDSGVFLSLSHLNRVIGNNLTYNETGVELNGSNRNVVEENDTTGGLAGGLVIDGSSANQILRNKASLTGAHGLWVSGESQDLFGRNNLDGNIAHDNLANGIFVETDRARIANNRAHRNAGYGIKATPGVIDGGGNIAHFNGEVTDCLYVECNL
jgi:parallel beta-helix repeat protein